jgi:hypothetical protein
MAINAGAGDLRAEATVPGGGVSIAYWAFVGALWAFGTAAALTIGPFFLAGATILAILGFTLRRIEIRYAPAVLIGGSVAPFYVAWLNRRGPGEVCEQIENGVRCSEQWSPWPLVGVGLILVATGLVLLHLVPRLGKGPRP